MTTRIILTNDNLKFLTNAYTSYFRFFAAITCIISDWELYMNICKMYKVVNNGILKKFLFQNIQGLSQVFDRIIIKLVYTLQSNKFLVKTLNIFPLQLSAAFPSFRQLTYTRGIEIGRGPFYPLIYLTLQVLKCTKSLPTKRSLHLPKQSVVARG